MDETVNIICMKWGTLYGPEYVNRLYHGIKRHLKRPFRFICFTENSSDVINEVECLDFPPFPVSEHLSWTAWRKFSLLQNDLPFEGLSLFLDLDVLITGPMDKFFDFGTPENFCIIHNWVEARKTILRKAPDIGNSSCFRFMTGQHHYAYERFLTEGEDMFKNYPTEQAGLTDTVREYKTYWPDEWVRSFKRHCQRPFPFNKMFSPKFCPEASVIAFHGKPNPDQAIAGYRGPKVHHTVLPTQWVADYWIMPEEL